MRENLMLFMPMLPSPGTKSFLVLEHLTAIELEDRGQQDEPVGDRVGAELEAEAAVVELQERAGLGEVARPEVPPASDQRRRR